MNGFQLDIRTNEGEFIFQTEYHEGIVSILQDIFGDKVHLPFGYKTGLR